MTNCAVIGYKRHKPYYRWIQHDSFMKTALSLDTNDIARTIGGHNTIGSREPALPLDTNDINHTISGYNTIVS